MLWVILWREELIFLAFDRFDIACETPEELEGLRDFVDVFTSL